MARVHTADTKPGPLPDIRADAGGVTYTMPAHGVRPASAVVIRCDAKGDVWISLRRDN
jgi:hypothetical protein